MTLPLTKIEGVPDRQQIIPGMAHFAGSGPPGEVCGTCVFFLGDMLRPGRCRLFMRMTRKQGRARIYNLQPRTPSCRHHEKKGNRP